MQIKLDTGEEFTIESGILNKFGDVTDIVVDGKVVMTVQTNSIRYVIQDTTKVLSHQD